MINGAIDELRATARACRGVYNDSIRIRQESADTHARVCDVTINNHKFETPQFMPVGTKATGKTLDSTDLDDLGFPIILANTYHLYLRPGSKEFMGPVA